jgi:hypothetical protein
MRQHSELDDSDKFIILEQGHGYNSANACKFDGIAHPQIAFGVRP